MRALNWPCCWSGARALGRRTRVWEVPVELYRVRRRCALRVAADAIEVAVTGDGCQVLRGDLDCDARRQFAAETFVAITSAASAGTSVSLDCGAVDCTSAVDTSVVGMLVTIGRAAHRSGLRLVLMHAPRPMRAQLEALSVAQYFDWGP